MARYVIVVQITPGFTIPASSPDAFTWEIRELLSDGTGSALERSGPTLVSGTAPDATTARHDAEVWAEKLAEQTVYVYNTNTQEPTPLP